MTLHFFALSGKYFFTNFLPNNWDNMKHNDAPRAEHKQTNNKACRNGNKNPDNMERNNEPGIANVCRLYSNH